MEKHKITTLDELYDYLKRFSLSDSLFVISMVNGAMKYGFKALTEDAHKNTVAWIEDTWKDPRQKVELTMHMTRLARFLLLSRANDYKQMVLDTGTREMQNALFLVSTLHEKEIEGEVKSITDKTRIMGRIGQWQFPLQADRSAVIGRGYLLFMEIPSKLHLRYDFDQKMREYFGLTVFQFITSGLAAWMMSTGVLKYKLTIEIDAIKDIVNTDTLDKFVELSSGTPEKYRRLVRGEEWKTVDKLLDIYALDPFLKMPAIRVGKSGKLETGQYVVPQPLYLLLRASLGIFYLLGDKERELAEAEGKAGRNDFREEFGKVYRAYVGRQLGQAQAPVDFVDIDEEIKEDVRKPDFALIKDDICVLFEVKTAFLTINPRMLFDTEVARKEIETPTGNFKKAVDQLNLFETAIRSGKIADKRFSQVSKIVKIIVGFEDLYLANPFLLPVARELYGDQANNLQIGTLSDIEILGSRLAHGGAVLEAICEKVSNRDPEQDCSEWSLGMFVADRTKEATGENPLLKEAFEEYMSLVAGADYRNGNDPFAES